MTQREFPAQPLVGVGAVVLDATGSVLLVKRGREPGKGRWSLPGGLVDLGETLAEAVAREIAEETGLLVSVGPRIEVVERIYRETSESSTRVKYHYIIVDYLCSPVSGELRADTDADEVLWIGHEDWLPGGPNPLKLEELAQRVIEAGWQIASNNL